MNCPNCGAPVDGVQTYCSTCGARVATQPAAQPAQPYTESIIPPYVPAPPPKMRKTSKATLAVVVVIAVVIGIAVLALILTADPDWKSSATAELDKQGYHNSKVISCDVTKGKNLLGWDIAKIEGQFTYQGSSIQHTYEITCRHMDNNWYVMFVYVDGEMVS